MEKLMYRFGLKRMVIVGGRGMLTSARIREELLAATEKKPAKVASAVSRKRNPLRGIKEIDIAPGKVINTHKALTKKCHQDGLPVHSFQTLPADLATVAKNSLRLSGRQFDKITTPMPAAAESLEFAQSAFVASRAKCFFSLTTVITGK